MRRWCVGVGILGLVVVALALAGAGLLLRGGVSARAEPSRFESRIARILRHRAIPSVARETKNPVPASPQAIAAGLSHFADHCASCHGNDGSGHTALGRNLYPRAPDMRQSRTQELTDGELFYIIENGVRLTGMPAWSAPDGAEGSWQLVRFIRHLPRLTPEEIAEMEALNPKSPDEWRAQEEEQEFLRGGEPPPREAGHRAHAH